MSCASPSGNYANLILNSVIIPENYVNKKIRINNKHFFRLDDPYDLENGILIDLNRMKSNVESPAIEMNWLFVISRLNMQIRWAITHNGLD